MKRTFFIATLFVILLGSITGCTSQPAEVPALEEPAEEAAVVEQGEAAPAEEAKPITITYWAFGSEGSAMSGGQLWADWYAETFKEYEASHPGVKINFGLKGYDASGSTLVVDTAVAAGTPPDIYFDTKFRVKKYMDANLLDDLTSALRAEDIAAYDQGVFAGSKEGNMIWSIPATGGYWNMIVNKTLFENAGIADLLPQEPDFTWTTDEFMTACKTVNDPANNVYCTAFFAGSPSMDSATNGWLAGFPECEFFDTDTKTYTVNSPACVEAVTFLYSIYEEGLMVPGAAGLIDDTTDPYWLQGQIAILNQGNWYDSITKKGIEDGSVTAFDYIFVQVPNKPGAPVTPALMSNPDVWGVFKQTDPAKQQAVFELVNYMQQPEIAAKIAEGWGKIPVRTDAEFNSVDPAVANPLAAARKFGTFDPYFVNGVPCNYTDVRQAWTEARQALWQNDANIQKILDEFVARANSIVSSCQ